MDGLTAMREPQGLVSVMVAHLNVHVWCVHVWVGGVHVWCAYMCACMRVCVCVNVFASARV